MSQLSAGSLSAVDDLACGGGMEILRPLDEWGLYAGLSVKATLRLPSISTSNSLRRQLRASDIWESAWLTLPGLRPPDRLLKQGLLGLLPYNDRPARPSSKREVYRRPCGLDKPKLMVDLASFSGLKPRRVEARLGAVNEMVDSLSKSPQRLSMPVLVLLLASEKAWDTTDSVSLISSPGCDFLLELIEKVSSLRSEVLGLVLCKVSFSNLALCFRELKRASPLESRLDRFL